MYGFVHLVGNIQIANCADDVRAILPLQSAFLDVFVPS